VQFSCVQQVCSFLKNPGAVRVYSNEIQAPYAYNGDQWVGYDDAQSLQAKVGTDYSIRTLSVQLVGYIVKWQVLEKNHYTCSEGSRTK